MSDIRYSECLETYTEARKAYYQAIEEGGPVAADELLGSIARSNEAVANMVGWASRD